MSAVTFSLKIECDSDELSDRFGGLNNDALAFILQDLGDRLENMIKLAPGTEGKIRDEYMNPIGEWIYQ